MTSPPHRYSNVVLGFAEEAPPPAFHPSTFPSKAGGLPIWLYRAQTSAPPPPLCEICLQPQRFLLQIYAPVEPQITAHNQAFHRVLYICICASASCQRQSNSATVLRAQLARRNDYYPYDAGEGDCHVGRVDTCVLCGFGAQKRCGECHRVSYCGRICQSSDWKLAHKEECAGIIGKEAAEQKRVKWRFREMEIVTEEHPTPGSSDDEAESEEEEDEGKEEEGDHEKGCERDSGDVEECAENGLGEESEAVPEICKKMESKDKAIEGIENGSIRGTFQDADEDELPEEIFRGRPGGGKKDSTTSNFQRIVSYAPSQVVRYERGGNVLWASRGGRCEDGGVCEGCGEERVFEMQVMAQLAWYVGDEEKDELSIEDVAKRLKDGMEWATVVVFCCRGSCETREGFVRERAWVQRFGE